MPELVVDPAALVAVAGPLAEAADRLAAVAAALPPAPEEPGPSELAHALDDSAHVWRTALRALASGLALAGEQLVSAATAYDAVEALVVDWAEP